MATFCVNGECAEVPDGEAIIEAAEDLGVPFGCQQGECATCVIEIKDGAENLQPKNGAEVAMGLHEHQRLACQARIRSGAVHAAY